MSQQTRLCAREPGARTAAAFQSSSALPPPTASRPERIHPQGLENTNGRRQGEFDCGAGDTRIFEGSRPSERPEEEERDAQVTSRQPRNEEPSALR
ncbi:hypothetical protein NDU88_008410 [Pleurodeles waltl]|uniref:Uncharacterized protein n=1 Tax=Pleurodeles waltl TaxID=8319 RepID=A0AAV7QRP0_PLEWA|nr:hypothetical protein NDU88_008410 [Pleurodeles waltl]